MNPHTEAERILRAWGQWHRQPWHTSLGYAGETAESGIGEGRGGGGAWAVRFVDGEEPLAVTIVDHIGWGRGEWPAIKRHYWERLPLSHAQEIAIATARERLAVWLDGWAKQLRHDTDSGI